MKTQTCSLAQPGPAFRPAAIVTRHPYLAPLIANLAVKARPAFGQASLALAAGADEGAGESTTRLQARVKELESFACSVVHELRAPLRAIGGFTRVVQEDHAVQLDAEGRRLLNLVAKTTDRMNRLIVSFMAFSRIGGVPLEASPIDMAQAVRGSYAELTGFASDAPPLLIVGALPPAFGDAAMIEQVCANLLDNAIKFTQGRPEARVEVTGKTHGKWNTYCVADNGVGFEADQAESLFEIFRRHHDPREFDGNGIGLAIVRTVVRRHGGRVWAESKANAGAKFYFTLPVVPAGRS